MITVVKRSPQFSPKLMQLSGTPGRRSVISSMRPGRAGNLQTLEKMAGYVRDDHNDLALVEFANSLVEGISSHNPRQIVHTLFVFVRSFQDRAGRTWGITYRGDPYGFEQIQDARFTLARGVGDCGDKVTLLGTLLGAVGIRVRFVVLSYRPPAFQHVFLEAFWGGRWQPLDPTPEEAIPGWQDQHGLLRATYPVYEEDGAANLAGGFPSLGTLFGAGASIGGAGAQGGAKGAALQGAAVALSFVPVFGPALSGLVGPIAGLFSKTAKNKPFSDARDDLKNEIMDRQNQIAGLVDSCQISSADGVKMSQAVIAEYYKQCDLNFPVPIAKSCRNFESQDVPGGPQQGAFKTHEARISAAGKNCSAVGVAPAGGSGSGASAASGTSAGTLFAGSGAPGGAPVSAGGVSPWVWAGGLVAAGLVVSSVIRR